MASPPGRRGSRSLLWPLSAGLVLGGATSAIAVWVLSGFAEPLAGWLRTLLVVVVAVAALVEDVFAPGWPWPQHARQVPQSVRLREPTVALLQFGFELGTGVRTFVTSRAPYVLVAVLLLGGLPFAGALAAGTGFGAGRALMPVLRRAHDAPGAWDRRLDRARRWSTPVATALVGLAAAWVTTTR